MYGLQAVRTFGHICKSHHFVDASTSPSGSEFPFSTRLHGSEVKSCTSMASPSTHALTVLTFGSHMSKQELQHVTPEGAHCFVSLCLPIAQSDVEFHDILFPVFSDSASGLDPCSE